MRVFSEKAKTRELINNLNNKRNAATVASSVTSTALNQVKKVTKSELRQSIEFPEKSFSFKILPFLGFPYQLINVDFMNAGHISVAQVLIYTKLSVLIYTDK